MILRSIAIDRFLATHGYTPDRTVLAEDASFRRYWRLAEGGVLMDAPPESEDVRPFLALQAHLHHAGLSVPSVVAADPGLGLVVLEDFGEALFPSVMRAETTALLYDAAVDALAALHAAELPAELPRWDAAAMRDAAAATFFDWWWPAQFAASAPASAREQFNAAMDTMLCALEDCQGLVHRDFFAGNLFWLPDRVGVQRVGIIDFQDAAIGHPAYDLVSLVEDARRALPNGLAERQITRYLAHRPELDPVQFRSAYEACAAQRHLRVAALWERLARRDGKTQYVQFAPHTWALLDVALQRPGARPLASFMDVWVPRALRGNAVLEVSA